MTTATIYEKTLLELDAIGTNSIAIDKGSFCFTFNKSMNQIIEFFIANKSDDNIRYIQKILTTTDLPPKIKTFEFYQDFKLPTDYFEFSSAIAKASNSVCKNVNMNLYEIKNQNKDVVLTDEYSKPSFLYREAPYYIGNDSLNIYVDDTFNIEKVILDYYRYPIQVRLVDPDNFESEFDEDFQVEFDEKLIDRIISATVSNLKKNMKDGSFQVDREKAIQKI